jgi:tetratricopeptide (TPR) repeat protein
MLSLVKRHPNIAACAALGILTFAAFSLTLTCDFVLDQDAVYVTDNPLMKSGLGLKSFGWSLMMWRAGHWHPVTWFSHLLDWQLFGPSALGHHLVNVLLHAANAILLFYVLQRLTSQFWASAAVAALFAVHPLQVESVAWVSQRKDVLSMFFMLLTILTYVRYTERQSLSRYLVFMALFGLGLMSKSMVMTLPLLLLLLDFWPLNRIPWHLPWSVQPAQVVAGEGLSAETGEAQEQVSGVGDQVSAPLGGDVGGSDSRGAGAGGGAGAAAGAGGTEGAGAGVGQSAASIPSTSSTSAVGAEEVRPNEPNEVTPPTGSETSPALPQDIKSSLILLLEEKYVLFAMSFLACFLALAARGLAGFVGNHESFPFSVRLGNALLSCVAYLWQTVWPIGLSVFYPHPGSDLAVWKILGSALLLAVVTVWVVQGARKRPYLAVGWLWYVIGLIPVIGLLQFGAQSRADHFMYLPCIGIFMMVTWGLPELASRWNVPGRALLTAAGVVVAVLAALTVHQATFWKDTDALFNHALKVTGDNYMADYFLGLAAEKRGKEEEAVKRYKNAMRLNPNYADPVSRRAGIEDRKGNAKEAERLYRLAVELNPYHSEAQYGLGLLLARRGELHQSYKHFYESQRVEPDFEPVHIDLAKALTAGNRIDDAIRHYAKALRINPANAEAHVNSAILLARKGKLDEAENHCREALKVDPAHPDANNNLGVLLKHRGNAKEAIQYYEKAAKAAPKNVGILMNLAVSCHELGEFDKAVAYYSDVLRLNPGHAGAQTQLSAAMKRQPPVKPPEPPKTPETPAPAVPQQIDPQAVARYNQAQTLYAQGNLTEAIKQYQEAVRLFPRFSSAHNNLGAAYYQLSANASLKDEDRQKLLQAAANHFQAAIQVEPNHAEAHNNLGTILMAVKRYDEAISHYSDAIRIRPEYKEAKDNLQKAMQLKAQAQVAPKMDQPEPKP